MSEPITAVAAPEPTARETVAQLLNLAKDYYLGNDVVVHALQSITLQFYRGDFVAVMGASGSGKSTLLNLLGCLDRPTSGRYLLGGQDVSRLEDRELSGIRSRHIGFVFQSYNLIPQLNVLENIEVPLTYQGDDSPAAHGRCIKLAQLVGLADRLRHRPAELSGGQQQRVAIARSLVNNPQIILADEPTGNLDSATGNEIMELLDVLNRAGRTIIMVTHESHIAAHANRIVQLRDGLVEHETTAKELRP